MEYIKKTNVPMLLLCLIAIRMLFSDASFAQSLFGLSAVGLYAYSLYLKTKEVKPLSDEVKEQLTELRSMVTGMAVKNGIKTSGPKEGQRYF